MQSRTVGSSQWTASPQTDSSSSAVVKTRSLLSGSTCRIAMVNAATCLATPCGSICSHVLSMLIVTRPFRCGGHGQAKTHLAKPRVPEPREVFTKGRRPQHPIRPRIAELHLLCAYNNRGSGTYREQHIHKQRNCTQ